MKYLETEGVRCVFGVPGAPLNQLYRSLARSPMRTLLCKHEAGAAFMADGYARFAGHLGVCVGTAGPGTTNLVTGVASAYFDGIPILVLTGQVPTSHWGKGCLQESTEETADTVALLRTVSKYADLAFDPRRIGAMMRKAIRVAATPRCGPVVLNLPSDCLGAVVEEETPVPFSFRTLNRSFDRLMIRRAATALCAASFPVILAGSGVAASHATEELKVLAEQLHVPVATTQRGKGAIPEDHPLSLGVYGFAGHPRAIAAIDEHADLVLAVGTSLGQLQTGNFRPGLGKGKLIQVDVDSAQIGRNYPVHCGIVGDAQVVLKELHFHTAREAGDTLVEVISARQRRHEDLVAQVPRYVDEGSMESDAAPIWPQRAIRAINRVLPKDAMVFWDSGGHAIWGIHYFQAHGPQSFVFSASFAAMGYSIAAVVGAKLARPDLPAVCVTGDGCFLMHGMEVSTAVNAGAHVVWIVFNNGGMRMVERGQKQLYGQAYSWEFAPLNFAKLGRALGAHGVRVERPEDLEPALRRALAAPRATVIDVVIDPDQIPPAFTNANA